MKLRLWLLLVFFAIAGCTYGQCFTYTVNACIDYDDHLNIRGDSLWWQDYGGSPPGTHSDCGGQNVTVNGASWFPWNSVYILPNSTANCTMVSTILGCSNVCNVIQLPTAANGWWGIYDFNDEGPSGAHYYSIQFTFYCPVVSIGPDTTICAGTGANLYAAGGATYSWSPAATLSCNTCATPIATPPTTTTYTVTATDANNCTGSASVTVNVSPIIITPATTAVSCFGGNNGSASITVSGGNPVLGYVWSNGLTTISNPNLTSGTYTVTVTDAINCTNTASAFVSQLTQLTASATATNVTCNGLSNGAVTIAPNGGTGPYTFAWSDGSTSISITNLAAGIYAVTITDNNSCTLNLNDTVTEPPLLVASATNTNVMCNGGSDGSVTVTVTGGSPPGNFNWNDGNTSQNRTQLAIGTYTVTATDAHGCTATASSTVTQPTQLYMGDIQVNESCFGGSNASITTLDTGGTAPYVWLWNDGNTNQNRSNLSAGNYSVTNSDSHLCMVSLNMIITQPGAIVITPTHINDSCFLAADGSINLGLAGGVTPFTFAWNDGNTNKDRINLVAGNYSVTVTDSNTCTASVSVMITQPITLSGSAAPTAVSCYGGNNGRITITDNGGTTPYVYQWNDGAATQNRTQLNAGAYTATITDALLCTVTVNAVVTQPDSISLADSVTNPLCPSVDHNGSIVLNISGGTSPYTYFWSNGDRQSFLSQLSIGNFSVTVTDANGCTADNNFALAYQFNYTVSANPAVTLILGQNEMLSYLLTGNAGPYTNIWTPDFGLNCSVCDTPVASPVQTTLYRITVKNDSGCTVSDTVTVYVIPQYDIFIPNAFAPGNVGANEFFRIYGKTQELEFLQIKIFNRVGEKVYESGNANFTWDGTYKGAMLPAGVYVYELKLVFTDGHTEKLRTGSVTLLR